MGGAFDGERKEALLLHMFGPVAPENDYRSGAAAALTPLINRR